MSGGPGDGSWGSPLLRHTVSVLGNQWRGLGSHILQPAPQDCLKFCLISMYINTISVQDCLEIS